ncbi:MAG: hypothetical protein IMZ61_12385 [Planctomycetes bacterium]|nr:hypothetical protein [Planctomycetota bacterium]
MPKGDADANHFLRGDLQWIEPPGGGATYATPALTLGTSNSEGNASTGIRSNATILTFDTTHPAALGTAAEGTATTAARRDHVHPALTANLVALFDTMDIVTASRTIGDNDPDAYVYQNTAETPMYVSITCIPSEGTIVRIWGLVRSTAAITGADGVVIAQNTAYANIGFMVPAGYYYSAAYEHPYAGANTFWVEWTTA